MRRQLLAVATLFVLSAHAAAPLITLDYPRGGEVFVVGTTQRVVLSSKVKAKSVKVELSRDGGANFELLGTIVVDKKQLPPKLTFNVAGAAGNTNLIRVSDAAKPAVFAQSAPFAIATSVGAGQLVIPDGFVVTPQLADGSVTNPKLAALAVTADKVASGQASLNFILAADGSGGAAWAAPPSVNSVPNFSGALAGDVTGTQSATVVSQVGGISSANIVSGVNLANNAASTSTANTLVKRDANGNFQSAAPLAPGDVATKQYADNAAAPLGTALNNEIARATAAEEALTTNLNGEIAARQAADTTLTTNLNNEIARAAAAEGTLTTDLNNEIAARQAADTTLTTNLNNEIARATSAEATLTASLSTEIAARETAGTTLTTNLNNEIARATAAEGTLTTNLNAEITARQTAVATLTTDLASETARATAAENSKVGKGGDTMTGPLTLSGNPTENLHAATKQYVDSAATGAAGGDLTGNFPNPSIAPGAVTDAKVASGISYSKLSGAPASLPPSGAAGGDLTGNFPNPALAAGAVTSSKILDGTIVNADVSASANIAYSKLALTNSIQTADLINGAVTDDKVFTGISYSKLSGAPTSLPPSGAAGGDLSGNYPTPTIRTGSITTGAIADGTITSTDISPFATIAYSKLSLANSIQGIDLVDGAISDAKISDVSYSKLSGAPASLPPSGVAGGDLAGNYPGPTLRSNAVTSGAIADNSIVNGDISFFANIAYSKLSLFGTIQGSDIAPGTMTTVNSHRALGNNDNIAREMRFIEPSSSGANYTAFKAQAQAGDITYTLPNIAPAAANQVLQVQSVAGNNATLTWAALSTGTLHMNRTGVIANAGNTSYTVVAADEIIGLDMTAGTNFTLNLPPATAEGKIVVIKIEKYNNALLPVLTVQPNGTDKIDSANNIAFGSANGTRTIYSDGAGNWYTW